MEDKNQLLKNIVTDLLSNGKKKNWRDYALECGLPIDKYETCRGRWKSFKKDSLHKGLWGTGDAITDAWKDKVERAMAIEKGEDFIPEAPAGFTTNRMHQQQTKDGAVVWLQSVERDKEIDAAKDFYDKAVSSFENIVIKYEPTKIYLLPVSKPTEWGFNLLTADAHIGSTIKDSMFGNKYSREIYIDRVRKWVDIIDREHARYGTFKYLNIIGLGDHVDGYEQKTTRSSTNHLLPQDMTSAEQFDTYVKSHIDLFDTLIEGGYADKIRFVAATNSNHGGDFEYACARAVEVYLNARYPDIETMVSREFMFHLVSGKHSAVFNHGKDKTWMKSNIPFVLQKNDEMWIENYINYHSLNKFVPFNQEKNYITAYFGDLHQSKTEYMKRFRYKRIMSVYGQSDWIEMNFTKSFGYQGFEWEVFNTNGPEIIEGREFYL